MTPRAFPTVKPPEFSTSANRLRSRPPSASALAQTFTPPPPILPLPQPPYLLSLVPTDRRRPRRAPARTLRIQRRTPAEGPGASAMPHGSQDPPSITSKAMPDTPSPPAMDDAYESDNRAHGRPSSTPPRVAVMTLDTRRRLPALLFLAVAIVLLALPAVFPTTALAQSPSTDATLSGLTVSPRDIIGFTADRTDYEVDVASDVTQATITATASDSGAAVAYSDTDADLNTQGHQVNLLVGRNAVTVTVTAADTTTTEIYTVSINRGVADDYGWKVVDDLDGLFAAGNGSPIGIWSDGTTMWVSDVWDDKIYAYRMSDKARDSGKDFDTLSAAGNGSPSGIWSDGTTMWVADEADDKIYAYRMSDQARDSDKDFDTLSAAGNGRPTAIWSNRTTMWVADAFDEKIYAYRMSDKARDSDKDFDTLDRRNETPYGIWSDGTTMWVSDFIRVKIYAYRMSDKARDSGKDFDTLSRAGDKYHIATGIWSDGTTMWVADTEYDKIFSYNMPGSTSPLPGVTVSPTSLTINEEGEGMYTVELDTQPVGGSVTVTINDPTDNTDVTASPSSLRFTSSNWDTAREVTVSAADDADSSDDTATVTHTVSGADYGERGGLRLGYRRRRVGDGRGRRRAVGDGELWFVHLYRR